MFYDETTKKAGEKWSENYDTAATIASNGLTNMKHYPIIVTWVRCITSEFWQNQTVIQLWLTQMSTMALFLKKEFGASATLQSAGELLVVLAATRAHLLSPSVSVHRISWSFLLSSDFKSILRLWLILRPRVSFYVRNTNERLRVVWFVFRNVKSNQNHANSDCEFKIKSKSDDFEFTKSKSNIFLIET